MVPVGQQLFIIFLTVLHVHSQTETSEQKVFTGDFDNICPGDIVSFECTVHGGTGTVWRARLSAFDCAGIDNEIILLHNNEFVGQNRICNNGIIVVQGIQAENSSYTSQLNITVSSDMIGETIECAHDRSYATKIVGYSMLNNFPPVCFSGPEKIYISTVDTGLKQITFRWNQATPEYPGIKYIVLASNCGSCPTTTNHTIATCINIPTNNSTCNFVVLTLVDENLIDGNASYRVMIKNAIMPESLDELIRNKGTFIAGIVSVVIAFLITAIFCCVYVGWKVIKSRSSSRLRNASDTMLAQQDQALQNEVPTCEDDDTKTYEYSQLEEVPLDLKSLLKKLQGQVSKQWYQFGLLLGIPMDILEGFNLYSEEDCLVEVLDHWLKHHPGKLTWQQITDAQRKIETFNDRQNSADKKATAGTSAVCVEVPPPKPPRRSSSVTGKKSGTTITNENNSVHEYEYIN